VTAIAGLTHDGRVYLAGDGVGSGENGSYQRRRDPKVFMTGEFAIGVCNSFRVAQVLHHEFDPPEITDIELSAYMVTRFIPKLRNLIIDREIKTEDVTSPFLGELLVGVRGRLFDIQPDYQVAEILQDFHAIGAAEDLCLGALAVLLPPRGPDLTPERAAEALLTALRVAAEYNVSVGPPYTLVTT
jgi:hypothetical protein